MFYHVKNSLDLTQKEHFVCLKYFAFLTEKNVEQRLQYKKKQSFRYSFQT